ncbi:MAG: SH3 domain-containing protein [Mangrovicoccus sp.]|nr:SH3 domain-containing protein [Mangrovicoccus sp.]
MKAGEANVRRGPSLTHRVDWVFHHRGLPLMVIAEHGHWRQVRDREGLGGWVHYAMLSSSPTAVVSSDMTELRRQPNFESLVVARAERDVVLRISSCKPNWCKVSAGNHRGWVQAADLWGATAPDED